MSSGPIRPEFRLMHKGVTVPTIVERLAAEAEQAARGEEIARDYAIDRKGTVTRRFWKPEGKKARREFKRMMRRTREQAAR